MKDNPDRFPTQFVAKYFGPITPLERSAGDNHSVFVIDVYY